MEIEIKIDPEFKSLIPEITAEERKGLEELILEEGCRDPLVKWDDILLDGHNRYEICMEHEIPYKTIGKTFDNRDQAKVWIIANQLSRRNLTPEQTAYLIGLRYKLEKKEASGFKDRDLSGDQNEHRQKTAEKIAKETGVSPATVRRDAQFADAVDKLPAEEKKEVLAGNSGKTKEEIIRTMQEGAERDGVDFGEPEGEDGDDTKPLKRDSENLFKLKAIWERTKKTDCKAFLRFIRDRNPEFSSRIPTNKQVEYKEYVWQLSKAWQLMPKRAPDFDDSQLEDVQIHANMFFRLLEPFIDEFLKRRNSKDGRGSTQNE